MSYDSADLDVVNAYFEEMIGCVAGCGCWEPGWDDDERIAQFATSTAPSPLDGGVLFANSVLETLDRLFASLDPGDMKAVTQRLQLHLPHVSDFRDFFGPSASYLKAALGG